MKRLQLLIFFLLFSLNILFPIENPTIVILESMSVPVVQAHTQSVVENLEQLGYSNDRNCKIVIFNADGDYEKAKDFLLHPPKDIHPDIIVSNATLASKAAAEIYRNSKIPLVFVTVADPVGAGLIEGIGQPTGTNITGSVYSIDRKIKMDLIMRVIKSKDFRGPVRVGYVSTDYPSSLGELRELELVAEERGDIEFISRIIPFREDSDFKLMLGEAAEQVKELKNQIDYFWEPRGPLGESPAYTEMLLRESEHMIIYGNRNDSAEMGALISFGPDPDIIGREVALMIIGILDGTPPGEISPNPPSGFWLGLNIQTAIRENLVIPTDILELAKENIFY
ncbi:MAG: hypothetical protein JEY91_12070 [Spirochaetaceae bacterium]|nr:hypothetical protein [Spirochaetaceae bacterium]